jgi:hypothetical protein
MSLLASFYLVPSALSEDLIAAAEAQTTALTKKRWGIFKPKLPLDPDPFWEFVGAHTRELDEFPWRGSVLLDVELISPGVLSSDHPLGTRISEITGSTFISYSPPRASEVIQMLAQTDFSDSAVEAFLRGEGRAAEVPEFVAPINDASQRLSNWLTVIAVAAAPDDERRCGLGGAG